MFYAVAYDHLGVSIQLFQLPDGGWRIITSCDMPDKMPPVTEQTLIWVDRNAGNVATSRLGQIC